VHDWLGFSGCLAVLGLQSLANNATHSVPVIQAFRPDFLTGWKCRAANGTIRHNLLFFGLKNDVLKGFPVPQLIDVLVIHRPLRIECWFCFRGFDQFFKSCLDFGVHWLYWPVFALSFSGHRI
jgi:hypothetical protein